jgi:hypothetical protein
MNHSLLFSPSKDKFYGYLGRVQCRLTIGLNDAKVDRFISCSMSYFATNYLWTKVGFINFNFTIKRTMTQTFRGQSIERIISKISFTGLMLIPIREKQLVPVRIRAKYRISCLKFLTVIRECLKYLFYLVIPET